MVSTAAIYLEGGEQLQQRRVASALDGMEPAADVVAAASLRRTGRGVIDQAVGGEGGVDDQLGLRREVADQRGQPVADGLAVPSGRVVPGGQIERHRGRAAAQPADVQVATGASLMSPVTGHRSPSAARLVMMPPNEKRTTG
jgi:hypothetical protein